MTYYFVWLQNTLTKVTQLKLLLQNTILTQIHQQYMIKDSHFQILVIRYLPILFLSIFTQGQY